MDVGQSFSPTNSNPNEQGRGQMANPVQDAIRILSFRIPTTVGANSPIPQGLLGATGAAGAGQSFNSDLALQWLRSLFSGQISPNQYQQFFGNENRTAGPTGMPGGGGYGTPPPSLPVPRITPGSDGRTGGSEPPPDSGGYDPGQPPPYLPDFSLNPTPEPAPATPTPTVGGARSPFGGRDWLGPQTRMY